jgi:excisionase family DNA binding protein
VSFLASLTAEARTEIEALVDSRVEAALAAHERSRSPKRWLTTTEAGAYLGCSGRAVLMRIRRGRIPPDAVRHQGRSVLIDRHALDRELERS